MVVTPKGKKVQYKIYVCKNGVVRKRVGAGEAILNETCEDRPCSAGEEQKPSGTRVSDDSAPTEENNVPKNFQCCDDDDAKGAWVGLDRLCEACDLLTTSDVDPSITQNYYYTSVKDTSHGLDSIKYKNGVIDIYIQNPRRKRKRRILKKSVEPSEIVPARQRTWNGLYHSVAPQRVLQTSALPCPLESIYGYFNVKGATSPRSSSVFVQKTKTMKSIALDFPFNMVYPQRVLTSVILPQPILNWST